MQSWVVFKARRVKQPHVPCRSLGHADLIHQCMALHHSISGEILLEYRNKATGTGWSLEGDSLLLFAVLRYATNFILNVS